MDPKIADTIAALRAIGVNTTASCAGHVGRPLTGGPYVMFSDPTVGPLARELQEIPDPTTTAFRTLRAEIVRRNLLERQKVLGHLEEFYATRIVPYTTRLIVESIGPEGSRLKAQGAELAQVMSADEASDLLRAHQAEMHAFTDFLRSRM